MKLTVLERIRLIGLLPKNSGYATFKIISDLQMRLSFTEREYKDFGISEGDGQIVFKSNKEAEIDIGEKAGDIIIKALKDADEQGEINGENITLYEKFIINT